MNRKVSNDEIFQAMNIYLTEWIHRDKHMWFQTYNFFFAALVVMFLPNLTEKLGFTIPTALARHYVFPILGIILSFVFFYVSIGQAKRLQASGITYRKLIKQLPEELQRHSITQMREFKMVNHTMAYIIPVAMFIFLLILGGLLIFIE